jgi:hypothetical protein
MRKTEKEDLGIDYSLGTGAPGLPFNIEEYAPPLLFGTQEARSLRASLNARLKRFYIRFPSEFWLSFS